MTKDGPSGHCHRVRPVIVCGTDDAMTLAEIRVTLRPLVSRLAEQAAREWLEGRAGDSTSDNSKLVSSPSPTVDDFLIIKNSHSDHATKGSTLGIGSWTVVEAKAKFSQVIDKARRSGPQIVTRNGRMAVVIVSAEEWERRIRRADNLAEFFAESPLRDSGL
jgi:prevent-host-death family protein